MLESKIGFSLKKQLFTYLLGHQEFLQSFSESEAFALCSVLPGASQSICKHMACVCLQVQRLTGRKTNLKEVFGINIKH